MGGYTGIPVPIFEKRIQVIAQYVCSNHLDGAFIFSDEYRAGFTTYFSDYKPINVIEESPQGVFVTPEGKVTLFLGAINSQSARRVSWIADIRNIETLSDYFKGLRDKKGGPLLIGLSGQDLLPVKYFKRLNGWLVGNDYVDMDDKLTEMRAVKEPEEIELARYAAHIGDMSLKACVEKMRESEVTEIDLCATAEYVMKSNGCDLSCATVLSSGMNTEVPTWRPTHKRIEDGEAVIIDVAPAYKGYATDVAVTVINGKATDGQKAILKASRDAVVQSIECLRPGEPASRIYEMFLHYARKNHVEEYFEPYAKGLRAVGHSIGLDCVERPNLDDDASFIMVPGMTLATKFDLHGMEWGGLRIETVMLVEENACVSLNRYLYDL